MKLRFIFPSLQWAARALRKDILDFWTEYPLELVPAAGPREALDYYIYSARLSWSEMELDDAGIPQYLGRVWGRMYCPTDIAWYGLVKLQGYLNGENSEGREIFLRQVEWLMANAQESPGRGIVWPYPVDWQEGDCRLTAPWPSAICQGHAISALVRAYRLTGDPATLELCRRATVPFGRSIPEGGIRFEVDGRTLYAEYPGYPTPRILDGFLVSLLGLHDLHQETQDAAVKALLDAGLGGLKHLLPYWSYRRRWTWYGSRSYLCSRAYHTQHRLFLLSLARVLQDRELAHYAELWDIDRLTWWARLDIFIALLVTKNLSRIRHRTWRQRTVLAVRSASYRIPDNWRSSGPISMCLRKLLS